MHSRELQHMQVKCRSHHHQHPCLLGVTSCFWQSQKHEDTFAKFKGFNTVLIDTTSYCSSGCQKGEPAIKHWFTSAARTKHPCTPSTSPLWNNSRLLPKTRGPHEYSCSQHCWRRNRIRWDQRREIPIVRKHTSTLVPYSMHAWWCCSLSISRSFSDIPPTHAYPNVEAHARTWIHLHALMFTRSGWCILWSTSSLWLHQVPCSAART